MIKNMSRNKYFCKVINMMIALTQMDLIRQDNGCDENK